LSAACHALRRQFHRGAASRVGHNGGGMKSKEDNMAISDRIFYAFVAFVIGASLIGAAYNIMDALR
jgi:hypothetical protein